MDGHAASMDRFLSAYVADNPQHARRDGFTGARQHGDRRYVALPCRGCCPECPGWHLVHDDEGARAYHFKLWS